MENKLLINSQLTSSCSLYVKDEIIQVDEAFLDLLQKNHGSLLGQHVVVTLCCNYTDTIVEVRLRQTRDLEVTMSSTGLLEELSEVFSVPGAHGLQSSCYAMQLLKHINSLLGLISQLDFISLILL